MVEEEFFVTGSAAAGTFAATFTVTVSQELAAQSSAWKDVANRAASSVLAHLWPLDPDTGLYAAAAPMEQWVPPKELEGMVEPLGQAPTVGEALQLMAKAWEVDAHMHRVEVVGFWEGHARRVVETRAQV